MLIFFKNAATAATVPTTHNQNWKWEMMWQTEYVKNKESFDNNESELLRWQMREDIISHKNSN